MKSASTKASAPQQFTLPLFDLFVENESNAEAPPCAAATLPARTCAASPIVTLARSVQAEPLEQAKPVVVMKPSAPIVTPRASATDLDVDNPKSASYRFRDTGHIAGSRKEEAASAVITRAKRDGSQVLSSAILWEEIERNPREAKALITKSNLFGLVDWAALRDGGMEPGAGFLIDRVYASIGQEPSEDHPQARKDYTLGLQTLRERLEVCKTPADVANVLQTLQEEYDALVLTDEERAEHAAASARRSELSSEMRALRKVTDATYNKQMSSQSEVSKAEWEISKRKNRGWSVKPEHEQALADAKAVHAKLSQEWSDSLEARRPREKEIDQEAAVIHATMNRILDQAIKRNKLGNPLHRAWTLMGDRFAAVLYYRRHKGSKTFANHVATAKLNKIVDWSWMESEVIRAPRVSAESQRFMFKVAEKYEREGGREVITESTAALKERYGLRDVQSGNWVLRDLASAQFHTQSSAQAFSDLADLLGVNDAAIGLGSRLGLAFGARGKGATGWKSGAPAAHYEPVHRVTNLTKNGGGGSLAHEWFHSFDNLVTEMVTGAAAGVNDFVTENPSLLPEGEMRDAVIALRTAMLSGSHRASTMMRYTAKDVALAHRNMGGKIGTAIKGAGDVHRAVQLIDDMLGPKPGDTLKGRLKTMYNDWRGIAIGFYGANPEGGEIEVCCGPMMSSFKLEAIRLDQGGKPYYRLTLELAARAFQSWVEDRLDESGRRNDYLSVYADNKWHVCPLTGMKWKPYPEGEERQRINAAFDRLVAALRPALA